MRTGAVLPRPDEIHDDLTRRRFVAGGAALAALLAGGCGAAPNSDRDAVAVDGFPRTITVDGSSIELTRPPERIYTNGSAFALDNLLALGVLPVLYSAFNTSGPLPWQRTAGLADVPATQLEPDVEQLAAERVDLAMLTSGDQYGGVVGQRIRELCPTVVQPEPPRPRRCCGCGAGSSAARPRSPR